ncbi:MAG: hypothetical protein ABIQ99_10175 [Thermoflexales bacterium]
MDIDGSYKGNSPERIAPAVIYLLRPRSSGLTGQIVRFDVGRLALLAPPQVRAVVEDHDWDAESIADAIEGQLADQVFPVGLADTSSRTPCYSFCFCAAAADLNPDFMIFPGSPGRGVLHHHAGRPVGASGRTKQVTADADGRRPVDAGTARSQ